MSTNDPSAAERSRRYRARRRERELGLHATLGDVASEPALEALGDAIAALVLEVRELRAELAGRSVTRDENVDKSPKPVDKSTESVDTVTDRDAKTVTRSVTRDATARARAHAPTRARGNGAGDPYGVSTALPIDDVTRHVTAPDRTAEILEELARAPGPASHAAIADAIDATGPGVLEELARLERRGIVERIRPADPRDPLRWRRLVEPRREVTIACSDYQAHRFAHRWDAAADRFRCFTCNPDIGGDP